MRKFAAVAIALLVPAVAEACASCGFGPDPRRSSFFWTMILLSLLPLGMAGGLVMLFKRGLAGEFTDPDAPRAPLEDPPGD